MWIILYVALSYPVGMVIGFLMGFTGAFVGVIKSSGPMPPWFGPVSGTVTVALDILVVTMITRMLWRNANKPETEVAVTR